MYLAGTRDYRLKYGPEYGADRLINVSKEDAVDVIHEDTGGKGVDIVIEAAGSEKAFNEGLRVLKKGGIFLLYGVFEAGLISVDVQLIQVYEFIVLGSASVHYPPAIKLLRTGRVNVKNLVSHRFTLGEIPEAFSSGSIEKRLGEYMKGVILF